MFLGAPIDSGEESWELVLDTSSLGFQGPLSILELGLLQTSPPCGTQVGIYPLSGPAIATERHGGRPETLKELTWLQAMSKPNIYLGSIHWSYVVHRPPGNLKSDHVPRQAPFNIRSTHIYTFWENTVSLFTSRIHLDPRGSSTEIIYSYLQKNKGKLSRITWADKLLVW